MQICWSSKYPFSFLKCWHRQHTISLKYPLLWILQHVQCNFKDLSLVSDLEANLFFLAHPVRIYVKDVPNNTLQVSWVFEVNKQNISLKVVSSVYSPKGLPWGEYKCDTTWRLIFCLFTESKNSGYLVCYIVISVGHQSVCSLFDTSE